MIYDGTCNMCGERIEGEALRIDLHGEWLYLCSLSCFCAYFDAQWIDMDKEPENNGKKEE